MPHARPCAFPNASVILLECHLGTSRTFKSIHTTPGKHNLLILALKLCNCTVYVCIILSLPFLLDWSWQGKIVVLFSTFSVCLRLSRTFSQGSKLHIYLITCFLLSDCVLHRLYWLI
jgi:hypothetical protein